MSNNELYLKIITMAKDLEDIRKELLKNRSHIALMKNKRGIEYTDFRLSDIESSLINLYKYLIE